MEERDAVMRELAGLPPDRVHEVLDFVRFVKEQTVRQRMEAALLSERSLERDWLRPEEDQAWRDL